MIKWNGTININEMIANVSVNYQEPTDNQLGRWYGSGTICSNDFIKIYDNIKLDNYQTEIGNILINRITYVPMSFSFVGNGTPKLVF